MKRLIWISLIFVLLLAACGGKAEPAAPLGAPATDANPPASVDAPPVIAGQEALLSLNSYRTRFTIRTEKNGAATEELVIVQEETRNPAAKRWIWTSVAGEQPGNMEMITVNGQNWINFGGTWMMSQQSPEEAAAGFGEDSLNNFDVAGEFEKGNYQLVGSETMNGVNTRHYVLNLGPTEIALMTSGMTDITTMKTDVWVADVAGLPNFTVKYEVYAEGKIDGEPGKFNFISEVYDINQPFTIELPAEAASSAMSSDIPQYPNATDLFSMQGMSGFKTTDAPDLVKAFFDQNLTANGWSKSGGEMDIFITYTKGGKQLQLMVNPTDSGGSDVTIMVQGE